MTSQDDTTLRTRVHQLADSCTSIPPPVGQLMARASHSPRRHPARRRCLATFAGLVSTILVAGNIATATAGPSAVPARAIAPPPTPLTPGTYGPVASLHPDGSERPRTLWLAGDPSGRSRGCVSLTAAATPPPSRLPNIPSEAGVPSTTCAHPEGAAGDISLGYMITLESGPVIAYGFVPASAVRVELNMRKSGNVLFRLVNPTTTVAAEVYGAGLDLPIKAWAGPDLSGFRVTTIKAFNSADEVVSELSFGE